MSKRLSALGALGICAALALAGCAGGSETESPTSSSAAPSASGSAAADVNSADQEFASSMMVHHEQAIEMSDILLAKDSVDAKTRALAEDIKAAQGPEIQQLRHWQDQWHVMDHDMSSMGHDMGMMSPDDLAKLREAEGPAASKLFLEQMIMHHEGAVTMAQDEVRQGRHAPAVKMAEQIIEVQKDEIKQMHELLAGK